MAPPHPPPHRAAMPLASALLDLLFAPVCLGCDGLILPSDSQRLVCGRCRARLRRPPAPACPRCGAPLLRTGRSAEEACRECLEWPEALASARSAFLLQAPADRLVHQLKYRGWHALAAPMGALMARALPPVPGPVVPVPTSAARIRQRGYNQAALLARAYATAARAEVVDALARVGSAGTQTALQPAARRANVAGAFEASDAAKRVRGAHVLLVDDVLTTGATVGECARVLATAGARRVSVATFARALTARRLLERLEGD